MTTTCLFDAMSLPSKSMLGSELVPKEISRPRALGLASDRDRCPGSKAGSVDVMYETQNDCNAPVRAR